MHESTRRKNKHLYLGVDVGGTKIRALLTKESGKIVGQKKRPTPREGGPEPVVAAIEDCINGVIRKKEISLSDLTAAGIAVPGVVDPKRGVVIAAPNIPLGGTNLFQLLQQRINLPLSIGNDANFGALGESWLGAARHTESAMYICVGTGIGGGLVRRGKLWRGFREAAGEIGHMMIQLEGPICGCGNRGCLEALASRTAIELRLREAIVQGRKTILPQLADGDLSVIRSSLIHKAIKAGDELVCQVVRQAAEILGHACVNIRHLFDPEVIILGGGLIEACGDFILPVVQKIVAGDPLPGVREGGIVRASALGDNAVALGAVAAARMLVGRDPFKKQRAKTTFPRVSNYEFGRICIDQKHYTCDVFITAAGKVEQRDRQLAADYYGSAHIVGPKELEIVCQGGPEVLFIGSGAAGVLKLSDEGRRFLEARSIRCEVLPTPEVIERYNCCKLRKAALLHLTC